MHWPGCRNVRDLGGLPMKSGGQTRSGVLVRADSLDRLTPAGVAAVRATGAGRILDLRSVWELPEQPHPFQDDPIYRLLPFIDDNRDHERDRAVEQTRADLYRGSVDRNGRQIAAAVAEIVAAPPAPVVVHCLAGVDRTGMLAAIVLDTIGVDRTAISEDYAASEQAPDTLPAVTIIELLEHLDHAYGGAHAYLEQHGVTGEQLATLRARLA